MFGRRRKAGKNVDELENWLAEGPGSSDADPPELTESRSSRRRRRRAAEPDEADESRPQPKRLTTNSSDSGRTGSGRTDADFAEPDEDEAPAGTSAAEPPAADLSDLPDGPIGPWDISEVPEGDETERIDMGALRVPPIPGLELRVDTDDEGRVMIIGLSYERGSLTLGVFAAPRSEGIWDEVRAELAEGIHEENGRTEERRGEYGVELLAEVQTPEHGFQPLRFVGIDGPRWFVRAVYSGPAAIDRSEVGPLGEALRDTVVVRGDEAMPVRDPLPLSLPQELLEQAQAQQQAQQEQEAAEEEASGRHRRLAGRGPEITEMR